MERLGIVVAFLILVLLTTAYAAEVGVNGSASVSIVGGGETNVTLPMQPLPKEPLDSNKVPSIQPNVKVIPRSGVSVSGTEIKDGNLYIAAVVELPSPCYHLTGKNIKESVDKNGTYRYDVQFEVNKPTEANTVCALVVIPQPTSISLELPQDANEVVVYLERLIGNSGGSKPSQISPSEINAMERNLPLIKPPELPPTPGKSIREGNLSVKAKGNVNYTAKIEGNEIIVNIKGCYKYEVEPLRCLNCYIIKLKNKLCSEENTTIRLHYTPGFPASIEILPESTSRIGIESNGRKCGPVLTEVIKEINESGIGLAEEIHRICLEGNYPKFLEKVCPILKEINSPLYGKLCEGNFPGGVYHIEPIGPPIPPVKMIQQKVKKVLQEGNKTSSKVKEVFRELNKLIEKHKKELAAVVIKPKEIGKPLIVSKAGLIDPISKEVIRLPKAVIETVVKKKPVIIAKENNKVVIEVNGPVRVKVQVVGDVEVDKNIIKVAGKELRVLPDEVVQKIKKVARNLVIKKVELVPEKNKPVYEVEGAVKGRLLFFIPVEVPVKAVVDAETGKELGIRRPWWSFLVFP